MPRYRSILALIAIVLLSEPSTAATRELVLGPDPPHAADAPTRPGNLPADSRLEELIREVYRTYENTVAKSGHDLRFRLLEFQTVLRDDFGKYKWLDLLPPDDGMQIVQERHYYESDRLRIGNVVYYDLRWEPASERSREVAAQVREFLKGASITRALELERTLWDRDTNHLAITSIKVELEFEGRVRTYRAAAFWDKSTEGSDRFEMELTDPTVIDLETAMTEEVLPVTEEELNEIRRTPGEEVDRRGSQVGFSAVTAPFLSGGCQQDTQSIPHFTTSIDDDQGHIEGKHEAQLRMEAECHYSSECHVQCEPRIAHTFCADVGNVDLPIFCKHTPHRNFSASSAGATNRAVSCGTALACGIKECCDWIGDCGDVSMSFSGSGGGLSASVSNSGSGKTYNLSLNDSIECPGPAPVENCENSIVSGQGRASATVCTDLDQSQEPSSPILIDFDRAGFRLTSLAGGVEFDIDGDGAPERLAWTRADSGDAFLALDRDGNGSVDDGRELFGNFTPQPEVAERNGFLALAVFDEPDNGGNGDGGISRDDQVFPELLVWSDHDHDGVSDDGELSSLSEAGVVSIDINYVESRRRDRHGNELRYASRVQLVRATTRAVDVFFVSE